MQKGKIMDNLISRQPEISRIEQELHGKTPEEQYEFLYWLLLKFGPTYTDSRLAVIEWLRGELHFICPKWERRSDGTK